MKVAIVTDSSGMTKKQADELGVYFISLPFLINEKEYFEDVNITTEEFYSLLKNDVSISTSQPSEESVRSMWENLLKEYDEVVHIPLSSGLSSGCESAIIYSKDYNGRVQVVNNRRVSVTLRTAVIEAKKMAEQGKTAKEIKNYLEETALDSSIYIMVDTLKYLKRGGRVTPAAAAIGTLLRLKPVLLIHGEKLDAYATKNLTIKQAKDKIVQAIKKNAEEYSEFKNELSISIAHTQNESEALKFKEELMQEFKDIEFKFVDPLPLVIACHIGPGALAATITRSKYCKEDK